jgi:hypothetical protein
MKRRSQQSKRRRERKSGISPYARYGKTPVRYSAAYYEWRSHYVRANDHEEKARKAARAAVQ